MTGIVVPEIRLVNVSSLSFDQQNPNKMSDSQFSALKENISRFGFNVPVLVDLNNIVADGEHRVKAAIELGMEKIPVIVLPVSETERKILRQVMNKLKGRHDAQLDIEEYKRIFESSADDFRSLMGYNSGELDNIRRLVESGGIVLQGSDFDKPTMEGHLEVYLRGNVKQIVLYFSHEDFMKIIPRLQRAVVHAGKKDNTEFFELLLSEYEKSWGLSDENN